MLPLPLLPRECLSRATGTRSSWSQQGVFHKKSIVSFPLPVSSFSRTIQPFQSLQAGLYSWGGFISTPPLVFFKTRNKTQQKRIQTSDHGCEMAFPQVNHPEKSGRNPEKQFQSNPPRAAGPPTWWADGTQFAAERCALGKAFQG